jgi:flagellar hook-associated protein 1 FlgK
MSLDLAFGAARTGLLATQRQLAQVAENLTLAGTPGHTRKELPAEAAVAGDLSLGLRLRPARRDVDQALLAERDARGGEAAAAAVRERLLGRIEAVQGRPEDGESLAAAIGRMREAFVALRAAPAETGLQRGAAEAARDVAVRFNETGAAIAGARQEAQDGILEELRLVNEGLRRVADITGRVRAELGQGRSAAALEDERDLALRRLSESLPVRTLRQGDGGVVLVTQGGLALPLEPSGDAFSTAPAMLGPAAFHGPGGSVPPILLGGVDVTRQLQGGRLGEYVALRDGLLPRFQAELDMAGAQLASRMEAQGLRLFTAPGGAVPQPGAGYLAGGMLGFANTMRLNPDVAANPSLLRDGTHDVADDPAGAAAFTRNPAGGPAGFDRLLARVLDHALGDTVRPGLAWAPIPSSGLGPEGNLASPLVAPRSAEAYATAVLGLHAAERAEATAARERAGGLLRGLDAAVERRSGVDPDAEMAALMRLQNAYAANARVLSAAQQMFDQLLGAVR